MMIWGFGQTMATHGHRGVGPSRGDESAGGSQAPAQQAQEQTGVPLPPPPPPVDYGALMQGLVHAMQTQGQTTTALQAQRERGPRKGVAVLVRAFLRLLDQGGASSFVIRNSSKRRSHVGGGLEWLKSKGRDYLTVEASIFELRFITPVGGKEASYKGVQFRISYTT
ncbi:hypothetical protein Taro_028274 [Colocasia esculenta]|uniref:Uncharacterized protein n=1 Tax=Colocasia esculenta TaxID=4460 RepID=A0A843VTQ2_COLES|nr:hypothetical protein [Colocasia esculenta]